MVTFNWGPLPKLIFVCAVLISVSLPLCEHFFGAGRHIAVPVALFVAVQLQKWELL
jgi:hypothetical protein